MDYKWLTQVYESVKPPSGDGKLLWHALGAKTLELINENVHLESVRDDIEILVLDTQVLEPTFRRPSMGFASCGEWGASPLGRRSPGPHLSSSDVGASRPCGGDV
jgi:hypothetical protein